VLATARHCSKFEPHESSPPHPRRNVFAIYFNVIFRLWHGFASGFFSSVFSVSLLCLRERKSMNKYESKQINCFKLKADYIMGLDLNVISNHISKLGHLNNSLYRVRKRTLHEMHWLEG
jgi:hypothetical protein